MLTCPRKVARGTEAFMNSYVDWIGDAHMLPVEGTLRDQSASWVYAVRIADAERSVLEREKRSQEASRNKHSGGKQN